MQKYFCFRKWECGFNAQSEMAKKIISSDNLWFASDICLEDIFAFFLCFQIAFWNKYFYCSLFLLHYKHIVVSNVRNHLENFHFIRLTWNLASGNLIRSGDRDGILRWSGDTGFLVILENSRTYLTHYQLNVRQFSCWLWYHDFLRHVVVYHRTLTKLFPPSIILAHKKFVRIRDFDLCQISPDLRLGVIRALDVSEIWAHPSLGSIGGCFTFLSNLIPPQVD